MLETLSSGRRVRAVVLPTAAGAEALAAQEAAELAATQADTARAGAESAASTAASEAAAAVDASLATKVTAAETARTGAETARDEAVAAKTAAEEAAETATAPTDATVAEKINTKGSLTEAALSAAIGAVKAATSALSPVTTPTGFSWTTHPLVGHLYVDQYGIFSTTLDPTTLKAPAGVTYWVDVVAGNDSNSGLTEGAALKSIHVAANKVDVGTIRVKGGSTPYHRARGFNGVAITKPINIIGYGGEVNITTHDLLVWSLTAGQTRTYEATRSSVSEVVDMLNGGRGVKLTNRSSIAFVEANPGSWYTDGTKVYVHTSNSRAADVNIWALLSTINFRNTGDFTTYLEGLRFFGGSECVRVAGGTSAGAVAVLNNVEGHLSQNAVGNNFALNGCDAVLVNCESTRSGSDGYGYHALNGKLPRAVEINCRATECGHSSDDQCSTMHDGGKIIRVQGSYRTASGAVISDVNDGTESWNLGCEVEDSNHADGGYGFKAGNDAGTVKMWLHGCTSRDARWSAYAYGTAQVRTRGSRLERTNVTPSAY